VAHNTSGLPPLNLEPFDPSDLYAAARSPQAVQAARRTGGGGRRMVAGLVVVAALALTAAALLLA
jgi:hypothetical protein